MCECLNRAATVRERSLRATVAGTACVRARLGKHVAAVRGEDGVRTWIEERTAEPYAPCHGTAVATLSPDSAVGRMALLRAVPYTGISEEMRLHLTCIQMYGIMGEQDHGS